MSYLKDFLRVISKSDYAGFLTLWEEYCAGDEVEVEELRQLFSALKRAEFASLVGKYVEKILPLWEMIADAEGRYQTLKALIDLQTTNSDSLRELTFSVLQSKFGHDPKFIDRIRLIGLRGKENFQCAISNYELLVHMAKGNFALHTGGWGVGEILDVSTVREQLSLEFDLVEGSRDLSFANAFKTLIPLPSSHFLALRFGTPDLLEKMARENPVEVIRMLLRDLGPKSAADIKEELSDLVIPEKEWTRFWQNARTKIKKDTMIETPEDTKGLFRLHGSEVAHETRLKHQLESIDSSEEFIETLYAFLRDFPATLKESEFRTFLHEKIVEVLGKKPSAAEELELHFLLQDLSQESGGQVTEMIKTLTSCDEMVQKITILAYKKRLLQTIRASRADYKELFLKLLLQVEANNLRDYLLDELMQDQDQMALKAVLERLLSHPEKYPETFLWYFQQVMDDGNKLLFADKEGKCRFFEAFLCLISRLEQDPKRKDFVKKLANMLSERRYALVRSMFEMANKETAKEFLLLATKCYSLGDHEMKTLHALAEVAHPSLAKIKKKEEAPGEETLWTTQEGFQKMQQRIHHVATVETVENAREIEVARAHGDLRENAEYKAALEKRAALQGELKFLSQQMNRSRILTKDDVSTKEVGIGTIVECKSKAGNTVSYTLLGPFDADLDKGILAFQSKLAQEMCALRVGEEFEFQGQKYTIQKIRSIFE